MTIWTEKPAITTIFLKKVKEKEKVVKASTTSVPVRRRTTAVSYVGLRSTGLQTARRTDRGRIARRRQRPNSVGMNRPMELVRTRTVVTNTTDKTSLGKQAPPPSVRKQNDDRHTSNIYKQSKQQHNHRTEHRMLHRLDQRCNYRRRVARDSLLRSLSGTGRSRSDAS